MPRSPGGPAPLRTILLTCLLLAVTACSFQMPRFSVPRVHKITVQQGNVITQQMVDRRKPGMTRSQVAFVMGEPVIRNTFDDSRGDYIYTVEVPGYFDSRQRLSIFFENDLLAYFSGDYAPSSVSGAFVPSDDAPDEDSQGEGSQGEESQDEASQRESSEAEAAP
jgi:outer membrane protein assembly factor BamE